MYMETNFMERDLTVPERQEREGKGQKHIWINNCQKVTKFIEK